MTDKASQEPTEAIDPNSDESAIVRVRVLALTAPLSDSFAADLERVCNLATAGISTPTRETLVERVNEILEDALFPLFGAGPYEATATKIVASLKDNQPTKEDASEHRRNWVECESCGQTHDRRQACPIKDRGTVCDCGKPDCAFGRETDREALATFKKRVSTILRDDLRANGRITAEAMGFIAAEAEFYARASSASQRGLRG